MKQKNQVFILQVNFSHSPILSKLEDLDLNVFQTILKGSDALNKHDFTTISMFNISNNAFREQMKLFLLINTRGCSLPLEGYRRLQFL